MMISTILNAQTENAWRTLAMMKYEKQFSQKGGDSAASGKFIKMIEALEGKEIELKGYIIPLSGKKAQSHFMFSAYPYNNCFFCGKAGPESVIEVFTEGDTKIQYSDKAIIMKGTFEFTSRNPDDVMFTLKSAKFVK